MLKCPNCQKLLSKNNKIYKCSNNHSFDIAKSGYTNLLIHTQKATGDNKEMVLSRHNFFKNDYYRSLKESLLKIIKELNINTLLDAGCGEGYYTNYLKDELDIDIIGIDMAKEALNIAAKVNNKVDYFVASVYDIPTIDNSIDVVLSIFAPISLDENYRILKDNGYFIKVGPSKKHLWELKEILYDIPYENEIKVLDDKRFVLIKDLTIKDHIIINNNEDIKALFMMTPYYYRTPKNKADILNNLSELTLSLEFKIEIYQIKDIDS